MAPFAGTQHHPQNPASYAAGADMPVLALPPDRPVEELDHVLEGLRPLVRS